MRIRTPLLTLAILTACGALLAKEGELKDALRDDLVSAGWIYEDVEAGYAEAKRSGKPLLVSFRCVP